MRKPKISIDKAAMKLALRKLANALRAYNATTCEFKAGRHSLGRIRVPQLHLAMEIRT